MEILQMESTVAEINNSLEGLNSRLQLAKEKISALED